MGKIDKGELHLPSSNANSASAMKSILDLHFPSGTVLDVNYGLGVFYRHCEGRKVVGIDINISLPNIRAVCDNGALCFSDNSFDVGVCDPPYKRGDGLKYSHRYGVAPKTETKVTRSYYRAMAELIRVSATGIIVKAQDGTDGHRFHARTFQLMEWMKAETGLDPHDIAHVCRKSLANTMVRGTPRFFKQAVSYFLVYKWRQKSPYRPVRF